jgi:hypothetical protein
MSSDPASDATTVTPSSGTGEGSKSNSGSTSSDPPESISNWWKGLVLGVVALPFSILLLIITLFLYPQQESNFLILVAAGAGVTLIALRFVYPACIYLDARRIRTASGKSKPWVWPYVFSTFFAPPPFEVFAVFIYLFRRRKFVREWESDK